VGSAALSFRIVATPSVAVKRGGGTPMYTNLSLRRLRQRIDKPNHLTGQLLTTLPSIHPAFIRRTIAEPTIAPSATLHTAPTCSGVEIPNPTHTGCQRSFRSSPHVLPDPAAGPTARPSSRPATGSTPHGAESCTIRSRRHRCRRRSSHHQPAADHPRADHRQLVGLFERQIRHQNPIKTRLPSDFTNSSGSRRNTIE
jgi:hypothetical protein